MRPEQLTVESDDLPEAWLRFLLRLEPETPVFSRPDALQKAAIRGGAQEKTVA
jgi:hypothetical protein